MPNNAYRHKLTPCSAKFNRRLCVLVLVGILFPCGIAAGDDWPMWRHDAGRSAASPQELPGQLHLQWTRELAPPRPAWPKSQDRLQFDASYEPIVAGQTLFVGSMVNDRVTAYDTQTGFEKWRFYTDGPVRFAPVVHKGKLYVASDDGYLYCLDADSGALIRRFLGGPDSKKVIGNDRLIGMWPVRGGPVLYEDKIYFAAGIWPFMGTFIYAVDTETDRIIWENSGSGPTYLLQPHSSPAFAGVAPQGYMVATEDKLLVSGGRSVPAAYDRRTGEFLYYHLNKYGKTGTCEVIASGDYFFNRGAVHKLSDGIAVSNGSASVVEGEVIFGQRNDSIVAYKLEPGAEKAAGLWQVEVLGEGGRVYMKAGSRLYCSSGDEPGTILSVDVPTDKSEPKVTWRAKIDGEVWSMLAADEKLFATTLEGRMYCFGGKEIEPKRHALNVKPLSAARGQWEENAREILRATREKEGYCLLLGLGSGELLYQLLDQSDHHIIALDPDAAKVTAIRRRLDEAGLYGTRVALHVGDITTMQLPPYMANLIVAEDLKAAGARKGDLFLKRVFRSLRPYGGTACFSIPKKRHAGLLQRLIELNLPGSKVSSSDGLFMVTRSGSLPGSAHWTHQYADAANTVMSKDKRVKAPLGLLWFGGPSNDRVLPRHGHGPSPQVVGGRLFIEGRNMLRAVDVYTGRLLWERDFPDLGRYYDYTSHEPGANEIGSNYVSVSDAVYVVYGDTIHVLDPATGLTTRELTMPGEDKPRWGAIMVQGDALLATASPLKIPLQQENEQKAPPDKKPLIAGKNFKATRLKNIAGVTMHADYASASKLLVAMDRHSGKVLWTRQARNSFRHNAVVLGEGKVFCIDGLSEAKLAYLKRRGFTSENTRTLYALDAGTGDVLWKANDGVFGTWLAYSSEHNVLLEAGSFARDRAPDEADRGMAVYRVSDGKVLWKNDDSYKGPPIIYHDRVITQNTGGTGSTAVEAKALYLPTGRTVVGRHPVTGQTIPWTWIRFYGCNTAVASEHLLTFRSASGAFADLSAAGRGTANIGGFKSGCTSNLIVGDGVLNAPDYTRTCVCSYQNQASLALVHMPEVEYWTFDYYRNPSEPAAVRKVGINFGAPGNRHTENGTLWLEFPSIGGPSPDIPVRAKYDNPRWIRQNNLRIKGDYDWIAASGVVGVTEVAVRMFIQPGENSSRIEAFDKHIGNIPTWEADKIVGAFEESKPYTVRLYFAEIAGCKTGRRVFDVSLQDKKVLKEFDIAKEAGGANRSAVREFRGILVKDDLRITLTPAETAQAQPLLNGIEIIAEDW